MRCPTFENLIDYVDGRLAADTGDVIGTHLATGCRECQGQRAWYERTRAIAASDASVEPPAWVFNRAARIIETRRTPRGIAGGAGRLIAVLIFDSRRRPLLAGARASAADARQLLYRAEDYSIDLQIASTEQDQRAVTGQVLREGEMRFESVARLPLALRGEFTISDLRAGRYDLRIDSRKAAITIVGLPVS
jgi:hypothetical protein